MADPREAEWRAQVGDKLDEWKWDPLLFAQEVIPWGKGRGRGTPYGRKFERLDDWMADLLEEFRDVLRARAKEDPEEIGHIGILVSSGNGSGKSQVLMPVLTAWMLLTRVNSRGIMTGPTDDQLKSRAWGFTRTLFESNAILREFFLSSDKYISSRQAGSIRPGMDPTHGIIPLCPPENRNERLFGLHGDAVFVGFEEAQLIPNGNFEGFTGTQVDPFTLFLAIGNPTRTTGWFRDGIMEAGRYAHRWTIKRCVDVRGISRLNQKQIQAEIKAAGGLDSDYARSKVLGLVPLTSAQQFIPRQLALDAQQRTRDWLEERGRLGAGAAPPSAGDGVQVAVDLARGGSNHTVAVFRRGLDAGTFRVLRAPGRMHTGLSLAQWLREILETEYGQDAPEVPALMRLDESGTAGHTTELLHRWGFSHVHPVNMGSLSPTADWANFRGYAWAQAKRFLENGGMLPIDEEGDRLVDELCLPELEIDDRNGKRRIESKQSIMKKNAGESPDLADAFTMLCLPADGVMRHERRKRFGMSPRVSRASGLAAFEAAAGAEEWRGGW